MSDLPRLEKLLNMLSSEIVMERATAGAQIAKLARSQGMLVSEFLQKTYAKTAPTPKPSAARTSHGQYYCDEIATLSSELEDFDLMCGALNEWEVNFVSDIMARNPHRVSDKQATVIKKIIDKISRERSWRDY